MEVKTMIKSIQFENDKIEINSSAGWLYAYRRQFGHDILPDIMPVIESILKAIAGVVEDSGGVINNETIAQAVENDSLIDAFVKMAGMELTTVYNIVWAMAYNKDKTIPDPEEYFNRFETLPVDVIMPEIFMAVVDSSVSSKNAQRLLAAMKSKVETEEGSTSIS